MSKKPADIVFGFHLPKRGYVELRFEYIKLFALLSCFFLIAPAVFAIIANVESQEALLQELGSARRSKDKALITNTLIKLGDAAQKNADYDAALSYYNEAEELCVQRRHIDDQIYCQSQKANVYDAKGDISNAIKWNLNALSLAQAESKLTNLSYLHNNIANLYLKIGSFAKSLDHYQQALEIKQKAKDAPGIANALMNMSIFYLKTGNFTRTLEYQLEALAIRKALADQKQIAATLSSISVTYRNLQDYPKAFDYNKQALKLYEELGDKSKIAKTLNNLGVLYIATDDLAHAKEQYLKAYELKKDSKDNYSILHTLSNLADVSLKLNQLKETAFYLKRAQALQDNTQFYDLNRTLAKISSQFYEKSGDYPKALQYFKMYHSINDSLANIQKISQLGELEAKYELRQMEENIELLKKNNQLSERNLQKSRQSGNLLLLIIAVICISAMIIYWMYLKTLRLNKKIEAQRKNLDYMNRELEMMVESEIRRRQEQEQKALRQSRLAVLGELAAGIAHELNQPMQTLSLTLENIMLAIEEGHVSQDYLEQKMSYLFEDITRMHGVIDHIRKFSKASTDDSQEMFDPSDAIREAADMLKDRLARHRINLEMSISDKIPPLRGNKYKFEHVLINLLSNAKDAVVEKLKQDKKFAPKIELRAGLCEDGLMIVVSDNGIGILAEHRERIFDIFFSTKSLEQGTGLGLSIASGIIQSMNGSLQLLSSESGARFEISIPHSQFESSE